ncbi:rho GTPase-activating protein 25 isoform X2 [Protopterus annectens]|uniref:rho GTPase-activating protein 25 isoform X2 n=1 Tax=Protopterus annectens TaxID=7888 RepID=UPI001CFAB142|nr:rho GTPase-activating protein 25 isoform X2 [Protopterus annectens]
MCSTSARSKSMMTGDHTLSSQSSSSNFLEQPLKRGWLKKQRSIVRHWQPRFFVLRSHTLFYYKDEDEAKPQGVILLQGSRVNELASNPDEPGKFLFEITPGSTGDREWTGQDTHVLMANSQNEMEEWIKAIRRVTGTPSGGVFGQHLSDTLAYEQKFGKQLVPILVEKCAEFIKQYGLNEEGIFRLPGQDNQVKQLRDAFDAGERPSFDCETDVHTVASLFKLYLRELPEPAIPWSQYQDFLDCAQLNITDEEGLQKIKRQLTLLPKANYNLLSYICRFLHEIQLNSSVNKMSVDNLATVIGVNILRPKIEDPVTLMQGTPQIQKLMTIMISNHSILFPKSKDEPASLPTQSGDNKKAPIPRSSVGWDTAEDVPVLPKNNSSGNLATVTLEEDITVTKSEIQTPKNGVGSKNESPRKRTQTLPNRKSSVISTGERTSLSKTDIFNSDFWTSPPPGIAKTKSMNTVAPVEGHKRALSEDFFKFLDHQRTSTVNSNSVSVLSKSVLDSATDGTSVTAGKASSTCQTSEQDSLKNSTHVTPLQNQTDGGKETVPDNQDLSKESRDSLQNMVIDLMKELQMQKKNYKEHIKSLENENYDVWAKVVKLNENLEQEKKKYAAIEIKLRNAERSKEDAEKRNKTLEQEIQEFLNPANKSSA